MKNLTLIFFLFFASNSYGQNYARVDSLIQRYPSSYELPKQLGLQIEKDFQNEYDKVRAVYSWIVNNVSYDLNEYDRFDFSYSTKEDFLEKDKIYKEKLSEWVISKNIAVCEGYSTLFKVVCDNLGITSRIVTGAAQTSTKDIGRKYSSDHAWNIVELGGSSFLIDATWGAGTYDEGVFRREADYFYFMTDPHQFIKRHYPDNYEDSLLEDKIPKVVFLNYPLIYDYGVDVIEPVRGVVSKRKSSQITFKIRVEKKPQRVSFLAADEFYDIEFFEYKNSVLTFYVDIRTQPRMRDIIIYIDNEPAVGYRVK